MKINDSFKNWLIGGGIVFLCWLSVVVFRLKAFCSSMALANDDTKIASIIDNLTAPVIGIASTILLYITLNRQREANLLSSEKNEIETFFVLFEDLKSTYNTFLFQYADQSKQNEYGIVAFSCFIKQLKDFETSISQDDGLRLQNFKSTYYVLSIIRTYENLYDYVNTLNNDKTKKLAEQKLFDFYELYLDRQLNSIVVVYESKFSGKDTVLETISAFIEKIKGPSPIFNWLFDNHEPLADQFIQ
ncbi:hypothetical protein [Edaphocola aurantiacus]|uniref:hypothetical protein n=1 Tax=Edaphocola aurantiacus TaxID=2601682 RepID=UPI001C947873|nr:hypothetical protein [Edaphocola aurantiacus]